MALIDSDVTMFGTIYRPIFGSFALLILVGQSTQQQEKVFNKFAGTYVSGHEFGGSSILLKTDGRFSINSGSDDGTLVSMFGTYTLYDARLHFRILKEIGKHGRGGREFNLLDPKQNKKFNEGDDKKIEKEFEFFPIEWSGRTYLIDEEDFKDFANAINLGIEPRATLTSSEYISPWYGSFYLREGDERKKVTGNPTLPDRWLVFLLSKPITATVVSIEEIKKEQFSTTFFATIDKGSREGLRVGMRLLTKNEQPSLWGGTEVISVDETASRIRATLIRSELKVGDSISSKYEPRDLYK